MWKQRFKPAGKAAGWVLGILSALGGLTFATTGPEGKPWTEFGVGAISISALVFLVMLVAPELKRYAESIREYPELVRVEAQVRKDWGITKGDLERANQELAEVGEALRVARLEGQRDIVGGLLALLSEAKLIPIAPTVIDSGLRIVARLDDGKMPPLGSRFLAQTSLLGEPRGILSVVLTDSDKGLVHLVVAEVSPGWEQFWVKLKDSAEGHQTDPGLTLMPDPRARELLHESGEEI